MLRKHKYVLYVVLRNVKTMHSLMVLNVLSPSACVYSIQCLSKSQHDEVLDNSHYHPKHCMPSLAGCPPQRTIFIPLVHSCPLNS